MVSRTTQAFWALAVPLVPTAGLVNTATLFTRGNGPEVAIRHYAMSTDDQMQKAIGESMSPVLEEILGEQEVEMKRNPKKLTSQKSGSDLGFPTISRIGVDLQIDEAPAKSRDFH